LNEKAKKRREFSFDVYYHRWNRELILTVVHSWSGREVVEVEEKEGWW